MKNMRIIDCHMHTALGDARLLLDATAPYGYDGFNVLSVSGSGDALGYGGALNNLACLAIKAQLPGRAYGFGGLVHPAGSEAVLSYEAQAALWHAAGMDGIKLIETKPNLYRDLGIRLHTAPFDAMWAYLAREGIPVLWHVGDPQTFWSAEDAPAFAREAGWLYLDGTFPTLQTLYSETESVLARHPALHCILAHFYFTSDDYAHAVHTMETYPNICFDMTPGTEMYANFAKDRDCWRAFFLKYSNRILFGTDIDDPPEDLSRDHSDHIMALIRQYLEAEDTFRVWDIRGQGLALADEALSNIYAGNFERITGGVRPIDRAAAKEAIDWTRTLLAGNAKALARADAFAQIILA